MIKNKYMRWGVLMFVAGVILNIIGWMVMNDKNDFSGQKALYSWSMIIGVILFGAGVLYILYSLIRKVDRASIIEKRATDKN